MIIAAVFFVQRFGTESIGRFFGAFMLLWFLMLGAVGAAGMLECPQVLKAFNPYYAVRLLADSPVWFLILGAVFLCTTGAEALYSDLGHCGRRNIAFSWTFVKATLILNYLGQGAWALSRPEAAAAGTNPFYAVVPQSLLPVAVVMATGAAIVASQALISGSFSILSEAMNLSFWPRMRVRHPTDVKGQLFIPAANAFMFAADLVRYLTIQPDIIFAKFASYEGTDTTGNVKELIGVNADLKGRKVIIVEDIVDTGTTLKHIQKELQGRGAIEVKTASLLVKPGKLKEDVKVDYCAMEIPDDFIVGYGMDYDGLGRNLKDIYTVEENQ